MNEPKVVLGGDGGVLLVGVEQHHRRRQRAARVEGLRLQPRDARRPQPCARARLVTDASPGERSTSLLHTAEILACVHRTRKDTRRTGTRI